MQQTEVNGGGGLGGLGLDRTRGVGLRGSFAGVVQGLLEH